jgi:tRNA-dihydrouridine synthase B
MNDFTITPDGPWLAPLAGYSDLPFRLLSKQYGCAVACSEMVSVKGMAFKNAGTRRLIATCPEDDPMVLQLFGAEPDHFGPVMDKLVALGYRNFDLNAGCPVRKVLKSGSGVKLMEDPDTLVRLASIMVERAAAHPLGGRVGVKFRLGFNKGEDTYIELAKRLEDAGVDWVTLHPRYGRQMFAGQADWTKLALLKQAVSIPVVASGDLFTAEDGVRCVEQTGVDAVMFARGALYDPSIFARYRALRAGDQPAPRDGEALARIVREHIRLTRLYEGDGRSFRKIRSIIPRYAKGLRGIRALRASLLECRDWEALEEAAAVIATLEPADDLSPDLADDISSETLVDVNYQ